METTTQKEIVTFNAPELQGIESSKAEQIKSTFLPMAEMLTSFEDAFNEVVLESQTEITKELTSKAKRLRIDIGRVRIETEKVRKEQKDEYLRAGKAIDGVSNIVKWAISDKENKLKEIENYFEIQEKKRLEALQIERAEQLSEYVDDAHERKLSEMDDDVWTAYYNSKKQEYTDRIAAEKQAEKERIAKEKAEAEEREQQRIENIKLKKEAEEKEALLQKERAEAEKKRLELERIAKEKEYKAEAERKKLEAENAAKLKKEQEEKAKIQAELQAKKDAEIKAEAEKLEAEKLAKKEAEKLAKAPIKKQLNTWVETFELPHLRTENEKALEIKKRFESFKSWAKSEIEKL